MLKKRNKMKSKVAFVFIFSLIILIFSAVLFLNNSRPLDTEVFYASLEISDSGGFDLNGTALTFGRITPFSNSLRSVIFINNYPYDVIVKVSASGSIEKLLVFERIVKVGKGETKKIAFTVYAREGTEFGFYDGEVKIKVFPA